MKNILPILSLPYTDVVLAVIIVVIALSVFFTVFFLRKGRIAKKMQKIMFKLFGTPSYSENFSFEEAKNWIKSRSELIEDGYKAAILNFVAGSKPSIDIFVNGAGFNEKQVKNFFKTQKYLVVAILNDAYSHDDNRYIKDSVLVKYTKLDDVLVQLLKKGNGILVVKGNEYK